MSTQKQNTNVEDRPLPVASFRYQKEDTKKFTLRYIRVVELNATHLKGFEIESEHDEEPGKYKTFLRNKINADEILLLHLAVAE
jgi:hypothetical protein